MIAFTIIIITIIVIIIINYYYYYYIEEVPPSQKPQLIKRCLLSASRLELIDVLERLIVKDPSSFPAAIKEAQEHKKHKSVAFLKLVQCAIEGDSELVGKLYGNTTGRGITSEVRAAVLRVPTRVPLELARTRSHRFVFREILIHTKLTRKHKSLEVHWNNLGVSDVSLSDLYVLQRIASVTVLSIAHNCLTSIQENFEVLSKVSVYISNCVWLKSICGTIKYYDNLTNYFGICMSNFTMLICTF